MASNDHIEIAKQSFSEDQLAGLRAKNQLTNTRLSIAGSSADALILAERTSSKMHFSSTRSVQFPNVCHNVCHSIYSAWALPRERIFHHRGISHQLNWQMDKNKANSFGGWKVNFFVANALVENSWNSRLPLLHWGYHQRQFDSCYSCSKSVLPIWNHLSNEITAIVKQLWILKIMLISWSCSCSKLILSICHL